VTFTLWGLTRVQTHTCRPPPRTLYAMQKHGPRHPSIPQAFLARAIQRMQTALRWQPPARRKARFSTPTTQQKCATQQLFTDALAAIRTKDRQGKWSKTNTRSPPRTTTISGTHTHPYSRDRGTRVGPRKTSAESMQRNNRSTKTCRQTSSHKGKT
jgi:hypothetical protein